MIDYIINTIENIIKMIDNIINMIDYIINLIDNIINVFDNIINMIDNIVNLGLGFKINTEIGLHTHHPPTHTKYFKGSRPSQGSIYVSRTHLVS